MKIMETELTDVKILHFNNKTDIRGTMEVTLDTNEMAHHGIDFRCSEQRIYRMPKKGTFFGIHFQSGSHAQDKIIHLLSGRGIDYVIDLRKQSSTYRKWIALELTGGDNNFIFIPQGYGHAFLSLEDNTEQLFALSEPFCPDKSMAIRYDDPDIGLSLPVEITAISDRDLKAPYLHDLEADSRI